jgi:deoxyribodipyrimidine photo-lyase
LKTAIWWVRRDLRLTDDQALQAALAAAEQVLPVFVLDPALARSGYVGKHRLAFLFGALAELDQDLRGRGSRLVLREGDPASVIPALVQESGAEMVFAEGDVSPYAARRDRRVAESAPVRWIGFPSVQPPGAVVKADGRPYTVFTPFSRAWKALPFPTGVSNEPLAKIAAPPHVQGMPLLSLPALPLPALFTPGEAEALRRLERFCRGEDAPVNQYGERRNSVDVEGTSGLSPYLRFGQVSPRRVAAEAMAAVQNAPDPAARRSAETWLCELIWREFYLHVLDHFPHARQMSFRGDLRRIRWENDPRLFAAWRNGETGYPIVDAAMRQLWQAGWMHNRLRMVVASFLTKDLHVDWRWGEKWFMQHLVDGDPAANNGGWQWAAGTGTDAAPYFRVFNPVRQGTRCDPQGSYIRRWLPELAQVPDEFIHEPWKMPPDVQARTGCRIGRAYPAPVVDHQAARQKALALYEQSRRLD